MSNLFVRCLYLPNQEMSIILMIKNYAQIRLYLVILKLFNFFLFFKASDSKVSRYALVGTWTRDLSLTKGVLYRWATRAKKSGPGWTNQDCLQHSNSEVCIINLDCL